MCAMVLLAYHSVITYYLGKYALKKKQFLLASMNDLYRMHGFSPVHALQAYRLYLQMAASLKFFCMQNLL